MDPTDSGSEFGLGLFARRNEGLFFCCLSMVQPAECPLSKLGNYLQSPSLPLYLSLYLSPLDINGGGDRGHADSRACSKMAS